MQAQLDRAREETAAGEKQAAAGQGPAGQGRRRAHRGQGPACRRGSPVEHGRLSCRRFEAQLGQQRAALAAGEDKLDARTKELEAGNAKLALATRQLGASEGTRFASEAGKAALAQVQFKTSINSGSQARLRLIYPQTSPPTCLHASFLGSDPPLIIPRTATPWARVAEPRPAPVCRP